MKKGKIIAIIPARGGSKSIPRKNIVNFCGKPLIAWSIEQAAKCRRIDSVYVSTDDAEIADVSLAYGAKVICRPEELATDTASSESALIHAISEIEKEQRIETVAFLQATSPLRDDNDMDDALKRFIAENADSLFSATVLDDFCVWGSTEGKLKSLTYNYKNRGRRQDRKPYYLENGSIYLFKPEVIRKYGNRLGGKIAIYEMPMWKSHEIDNPEDLELCEYYMRKNILKGSLKGVKLKNIELIVYDFDGVMTNNTVLVREDGLESVTVSRADGLATGMIKKKGIPQIILTMEKNKVVEARAKKLDLPILKGVDDKKTALKSYCKEHKILLKNVVYVGNDINDLDVMKTVGYPVCPSDANVEIKKISSIILTTPGGSGVIREFVGLIE
jgi:N-acylneuraminate cytidylyltransferase